MSNDVVSIVAGGWSFREVDHAKLPGSVIAVNDSLVYLEKRPDYVVSMDRLWTENRWEQLKTAGLKVPSVEAYIRINVLKNVTPAPDWKWFHVFSNHNNGSALSGTGFETGINGRSIGHLNGANSGACAVNLAYVLEPSTLYLFGFDMCLDPRGQAHWYPQYPWAAKQGSGYSAWPQDFNCYAQQFAARGCKVVNVSSVSKITSFKRVTPRELGVAK